MNLEIALFATLFTLYSWALVRLGRTMGEKHAAKANGDSYTRGYERGFAEGTLDTKGQRERYTDVAFQRGVAATREEYRRAASARATKGWQKRRASDAGINEEVGNG
jgi:hypothetical protein